MVALCTELDGQLQRELLVELILDHLLLLYLGIDPLPLVREHSVIGPSGKAFH